MVWLASGKACLRPWAGELGGPVQGAPRGKRWSLGRPDARAVQVLVAWQAAGILPTQGGTAWHPVTLRDVQEVLGRLSTHRVVRVGEEALLVVRPP